MTSELVARLKRLWPLVGVAYLVSLLFEPPPVRWVAIACLVVVTPFVVGWLAGTVAGVGPWADGE